MGKSKVPKILGFNVRQSLTNQFRSIILAGPLLGSSDGSAPNPGRQPLSLVNRWWIGPSRPYPATLFPPLMWKANQPINLCFALLSSSKDMEKSPIHFGARCKSPRFAHLRRKSGSIGGIRKSKSCWSAHFQGYSILGKKRGGGGGGGGDKACLWRIPYQL